MSLTTPINAYRCDVCGGVIVTEDLVEGTTPAFLTCKAARACHGTMLSMWYRVSQNLHPQFEWYKPGPEEMAKLSAAELQHVEMGGLLLRSKQDGLGEVEAFIKKFSGVHHNAGTLKERVEKTVMHYATQMGRWAAKLEGQSGKRRRRKAKA